MLDIVSKKAAKPSAKPTVGPQCLIGRGFHTVDERGRTKWQGQFLAAIGDYMLCQLFEWIHGYPSTQHLIPVSDIASVHPDGIPRFRIFENMEEASEYMDIYARHRDRHIDEQERGLHEARPGRPLNVINAGDDREKPPPRGAQEFDEELT